MPHILDAPGLRRAERVWGIIVTIGSAEYPGPAVESYNLEGGSLQEASGAFLGFTGPPPQRWKMRAPEPAAATGVEELQPALTDLASLASGWRLKFTTISRTRMVHGDSMEPALEKSSVWSLAGYLNGAGAQKIPVGASGRGTGLQWLNDPALLESLRRQLQAVDAAEPMPDYSGPAILAPAAAALISHEAVGHFAEAAPMHGADLRHRLGCRIASEILSYWDDPLDADGSAHYETDDEGILSLQPTVIVRDGVLVNQLHSLGTARLSQAVATANGRASCAWAAPIPRMSNLICSRGDAADDELVERLWSGIYIHRLADGTSSGAFVEAEVILAERVERGRRTGRFLTGGRVLERTDLLTRAVELGANRQYNPNAMCGRAGQILFDVGSCAPSIRLSKLTVAA